MGKKREREKECGTRALHRRWAVLFLVVSGYKGKDRREGSARYYDYGKVHRHIAHSYARGGKRKPAANGSAPNSAAAVPAFLCWLSKTIAAAAGAARPKKNIIANRVDSTAQMPKSAQIKNAPAIIAKKTRKVQPRILVGGNNDK